MFVRSRLVCCGCSAVKQHVPEDNLESCSRSIRHNSWFTVATQYSMFVIQSEKVEKTTKNPITIAHKQRDSDLIQKLMTCPFASPPPPPPLSFIKFSRSVSGTRVDYYTP